MGSARGSVAVRLLGPLEVQVNGVVHGPRDFGGVKPKQVLEALLVARGRALGKDELAELLWGEAQPENIARTLESYVSVLRSHLAPARELVVTETGAYRVDVPSALSSWLIP